MKLVQRPSNKNKHIAYMLTALAVQVVLAVGVSLPARAAAWSGPASQFAVTNGECDKDGVKIEPGKEVDRNCNLDFKAQTACTDPNGCGIEPLMRDVINILSGAVGIIVIGMVMYSGIRYIWAGGDPQAIALAKKHLRNALISFVAYIFMAGFLQWLVPGGVFN